MKRAPSERANRDRNQDLDQDEDESPGVPGFRTWPGVYIFVFGCFVLTVLLLALLTRVYS